MDELWSFVDNKGNQQWVWLALDTQTREIVGVQMVDRSAVSEECFMEFNATSLPSIGSNLYRSLECWEMLYCPVNVIVDKDSGCTSYIERFNCTIRRVSRLVRKSLSFSKKLENHIADLWRLVHHYNASLQL
jgi:IS1 family transposase